MDSLFNGDLTSRSGRWLAWIDSLLVDHAVLRLVWGNEGVVVPGRLYRANHPTPGRLARLARRWRLRSVINLRGATTSGSDALAREAAARLGLVFIDAPVASRTPRRADVLALCEALRTMPEPALVHCKSGADRAGFAAAVFLLLQGATSAAALAQLSWRHGHLRGSRTGILDALIRRYAEQAEGRISFPEWVRTEFDDQALERDFAPRGLASFIADRLLARE